MNPRIYQALAIAKGLEVYAACGLKVNRDYTPSNMIRMANKITGHIYRRGQYKAAALALREWAQRQEA